MTDHLPPRIYLSTPHLGELERRLVGDAFATNWVAPLGPHVDGFEAEFADVVGTPHAVALSSGTAALHLGLILVGVGPGDEVLVSDLTFSASVNPIVYLGARPILVDSEPGSWTLDPDLLGRFLARRAAAGRVPKALILVHLYGQSADIDPILDLCERYGVALIEDAAEAVGTTYRDQSPGTFGTIGAYSFNGNKIITTSGGGMLVSPDRRLAERARKLATQAREEAPHYEHTEIGYNYRMSNVLAAIGRGQLRVLDDRIARRRANFAYYESTLGELPGIGFMPEAPWGRHTRWLTCITVDPAAFGADREAVRLALEDRNIEARPVWKPMHLQPVFQGAECVGGSVGEELFERGLCLPSGSNLTRDDLERVVEAVQEVAFSGVAAVR
ncbi:MAG: 4-keto-6-deoxy-N-acetyl-D-hexosaminyl-(lipid carrier) aminotransferase [Gemmatimonadetes bacterium]|nr:4-keto-6-deoxy-N-acetyl-D-hexosaminyl-(lipid carrier) aminotransferase [Gemmatimonadota bacterium]